MKSRTIVYLVLIAAFSFLGASQSDHFKGPNHFPEPVYNFAQNKLNLKKIALGRKLFYDPIFSKDSTVSCASCHSPFNAFAHTDHDLSHGIHDSIGTRNAPALINLAWQEKFMWDGAINHLDVQALAPISHPGEMAEDIRNIANKLKNSNLYAKTFYEIYGDYNITGERILKSLSQFQLTLVSANAKYDSVVRGEKKFTIQEETGYQLFRINCGSCHVEPLFSSYQFANNGLAIDTTLNDVGRYKVTKKESDRFLFKIPTLRNLSFTYPYMHDGRFNKLRQVLHHYSNGIVHSPSLAPQLKNNIKLSSNEKTDLIAFLHTLNDQTFVFNKKHSFPKFENPTSKH
jgi:cytochrome c peroxidase